MSKPICSCGAEVLIIVTPAGPGAVGCPQCRHAIRADQLQPAEVTCLADEIRQRAPAADTGTLADILNSECPQCGQLLSVCNCLDGPTGYGD